MVPGYSRKAHHYTTGNSPWDVGDVQACVGGKETMSTMS